MDAPILLTTVPLMISFAAVLLGLWAARRLIAPLTDWFGPPAASRRPLQIILWLALGSLFSAPVTDLLSLLDRGVQLVTQAPEFIQFGLTPQPYYDLLIMLLLLVVYGVVIWLGRGVFNNLELQGRRLPNINWLEKALLLLVPASLIYRLLRGLVMNIVLLPVYDPRFLNASGPGIFFLLALGSLVVVAGLIVILYLQLRGEDLRKNY